MTFVAASAGNAFSLTDELLDEASSNRSNGFKIEAPTMSFLDFRLQHLQKKLPGGTRLHVLLQYQNSVHRLAKWGFKVSSVAGDIAAGSILVSQLDELAQDPDVSFIGGSRLLKDEVDVGSSHSQLSDPVAKFRAIPTLGAGAIIGVIDSGFDL